MHRTPRTSPASSPSRRRAGVLTLAVTLVLVVSSTLSPASADTTTTVAFDDLTVGTAVGTQYAGQGVTFVETAGEFGSTGLPIVLNSPSLSHTPSNVVESSCFGCEFVPHSIRANLATTARDVSAHVASGCDFGATVSMRGYTAGGDIVATASALVDDTAMVPLTISDPSGSDIAFVRFFDDQPGCTIRVDTFAVTLPDDLPPADLGLSTSASVVTVAAGAPQTVPISVTRVNGSTGNLSLAMTGHGAGVTPTFTPNPVTGTDVSSQLVISASTSAPYDESGSTVVTVTGTPASASVAPGPRTTSFRLRVVPTLETFAPATMTAPVCSTTNATVQQRWVPGYPSTISLGATGIPAGVSVSFSPPTGGGATNPSQHTMQVAPGPGAALATTPLVVQGSGPGATSRSDTLSLTVAPLQFTEVPAQAKPGATVTLRSSGFCAGSQFRFGNDQATVTPGADAYNADRTRVTLTVPRYATSGPVRVFASGTQVGASSRVEIGEFRRMTGFSFVNNYGNHPMNHAILERTYGRSETNLSIDLCWPFGCSIVTDWIDPLAWVFMKIANEVLTSGSCFGIAMTGQRIAKGHEPISRFTPAGATTPWELDSSTGPAPTLRNTISGWHSVQLSTQFIQKWVREFVNNAVQPAEILRSRFLATSPTSPAMVSIKEGTSGHAFIAYGARPLAGGGWEVDINDPNIPYTLTEETDIDGSTHVDNLTASTLTFDSSGNWTYADLGWSGGREAVALVPMSEWPRDPSMPTGLRDLLSLIVPFGEAPAGSVTDAEGNTLNADGTGTLPGQTLPMLSGVDDHQVAFIVDGTGPLTYSVPNTDGRTYGQGLVGPGLAARVDGIEATAGQTDLIGSDAGTGTVWLDPAGPAGALEVEVARQESGKGDGQRLVDLDLGGVADDRLGVTVPKGDGALVVDSDGGTVTVTGTVGRSGGSGQPGTIRLPETTLEPGQRMVVRPKDWDDLATRPTTVEVRDADGDVVSSATVRPPSPDLLRKTRATLRTATGEKRVLVVTARAVRLPAGSHLVQKVQVLRGKKVVRTVQRDRDWRGGKSRWTAKLRLPDGRYTLRLVSAAAVFRNGVPTSDVVRRTSEVSLH
ncbi:MAG TPA: hypothetical protein VFU12_16525 [Glycomyces sp.]|nr:hypothetical protein [Glycomyces sp.]